MALVHPDWYTAAYPHNHQIAHVGLFGWKSMHLCSCGISASSYAALQRVHYAEEVRIGTFMRELTRKRTRKGPYWE